jgi:hypothetical protein
MAPPEGQQQNPNPAPPSPSAGDHEMRDYYATQDLSRPPSQQEPYLTPYLGLRARLSQTWINRWTILLLLVLIRTLFAIASLNNDLATAKKEAMSTCTSVENVGSAMASMPYYLAQGVNELSASGIEKAINGLMEMLILTITGVEEIVLFIINLLTQTYLCLITMAVTGSLHAAIIIAEDVGGALNATVKDVGKGLGDVETGIADALNKVSSFASKFGINIPKLDLSSQINSLDSIQLPAGYDSELQKLNASIPTFADVKNFTTTVIELPFEEVKKLLNESLPKYTMNRSLFPVPVKKQLTFCSDNGGVETFFDDMADIVVIAKKVFLAVLIILAIAAMAPMAWREIRRWKFTQGSARLVKSDSIDPLDSVYIASRPYTSRFGLWLSKFFNSKRRQNAVRWSVAYATTVPALFVLTLAITGLLGCLCQYILLKAVEKEVPAIENDVIGFADKVINELNDASEQWSNGVNNIINDTSTTINHDVFGWVNTTTHAVNDTLNVFVNETMKVLNDTFGGTILYDPIVEVLNCLVLMKIQGIENGLTWVSDHAYVDFPMLPNDTFSFGTIAKVSGSEADILNTGPNGTAANDIADAVYHVTNMVAAGIRQEAIISICVLLIWVIIALVGVVRALMLMRKGGDDGTYYPSPRQPNDFYGPATTHRDSLEMDEFGLPRVPTYEQAVRNSTVRPLDPGNHAGNKYNGQSYTLTPNPAPNLDAVQSATSPILHTGFSPQTEKFGSVGSQNVDAAIRRQTHVRASSHGDYGLTSPVSPVPMPPAPATANPFPNPANTVDDEGRLRVPSAQMFIGSEKENPFADPTR